MSVVTPEGILEQYFQSHSSACETCDVCFTNICEHLDYAKTDIFNIEKEKRGQHENPN